MKNHILKKLPQMRRGCALALGCAILAGCGGGTGNATPTAEALTDTSVPTNKVPTDTPTAGILADTPTPSAAANQPEGDTDMNTNTDTLAAKFDGITLATGYKKAAYNNPVMTQRFGADPYALVYDGRVYLYMTADIFEYESTGEVKTNSYSKINSICVISSSDLVNWTDHGTIYAAGRDGAATWANNSWAPAAACKEIDGKMKFFLYFANSGGGIPREEFAHPYTARAYCLHDE